MNRMLVLIFARELNRHHRHHAPVRCALGPLLIATRP